MQIKHFFLAPDHTLIGSYTVFLTETTSTNDSLKLLFTNESLPDGTVMYTDFQVSGRGQQQTVWESESCKNLLMSVLLLPVFLQADEQLWLNVCICLALRETVEELSGIAAFIKWPNDIYCADKKIAGILIENVLQGNKIKYTIIGLGLNVNQNSFITNKAISLALLCNKQLDVNVVRKTVCKKLSYFYTKLKAKQWSSLWSLYHQYLYGRGNQAYFLWKGEKVEAQILGLDKLGRLHLLIMEEVRSFGNKEIEFLSLKK
ncbi:MAG: biotin--[acetyl-CoA-carboxylase] ligase [Bacteroidia bacterium]|nr:biotin--[acetyl-CoA-carboxylase] ligase [Bacteroidia bacterium]